MDKNIDFILECLMPGDDDALWGLAVSLFFKDALNFLPKSDQCVTFLEIGACSRWLSSDNKRFSESQGVPLPEDSEKDKLNYSRLTMPEYDWSVLFYFDKEKEEWVSGDFPESNYKCFHAALPAKSSNLHHAVGYTVWMDHDGIMTTPGLYTFRKTHKYWECLVNPNDHHKVLS